VLALKVVVVGVEVEVEGVSEMLASEAAPQFGADFVCFVLRVPVFLPGHVLKLPSGAVPLIAIG
jgi:hypothetical protein